MKFNIRKGGMELRSCDKSLTNIEEHDRVEIVMWEDDEHYYTLAHFEPDTEGWFDLVTVGDRFTRITKQDESTFFQMIKVGFAILTLMFPEEE